MKTRRPRAELYAADRELGMTYNEIAKKYGVSHQTVAQALGKYSPNRFKPYTAEEVVYPNLRRWLNEEKVSRREFARRIGWGGSASNTRYIGSWFGGTGYPQKQTIDRVLAVTGMTYEELWSRGDA